MDNRAYNQWKKARVPYKYYQNYLNTKPDRCCLSVIDLIFIANFKGGSATIAEPESSLMRKLPIYSTHLEALARDFGTKKLGALTESELGDLVIRAHRFLSLTRDFASCLDGFGPSFASAILNSHIPSVLPILDKRGLNGANIGGVETNSQGQVIEIEKHYGSLICYVNSRMAYDSSATIESIDQELFSCDLVDKYKQKAKRTSITS